MDDVVDRIINSYENLPAVERRAREEIKMKVGQYLAKLSSAGHRDPDEVTECGLALQLPICFKVRALSGGLVSSTPE
jgi:hypothetical protein